MKKMTKEYVLRTLREEHLWKPGEADTFEATVYQKWEFTLKREEKHYLPYKYSLTGKKIGTLETWARRYRSMEEAFLHIDQKWEFTLKREEKHYLPYKYSLTGKKIGTLETWARRYRSMEEAFLHIANRLNENAVVKNKYTYIEDWLLENK